MLKDLHDSRRKDKLITGSSVLIHIYDRCDEVRGKVNGKILHQRKKKMSTRFSDGVIVKQWCENVIIMLRNLKPFAKPEHGVFSLPSYIEGVPQKWKMSSSLDIVWR